MPEANRGVRGLQPTNNGHALRTALATHQAKHRINNDVEQQAKVA